MSKLGKDVASRLDEENPEWTTEAIANAKPALKLLGQVFGERAAGAVHRETGRRASADPRSDDRVILDPDVLAAYRKMGPDWQTLINRVLREKMTGADSEFTPVGEKSTG